MFTLVHAFEKPDGKTHIKSSGLYFAMKVKANVLTTVTLILMTNNTFLHINVAIITKEKNSAVYPSQLKMFCMTMGNTACEKLANRMSDSSCFVGVP